MTTHAAHGVVHDTATEQLAPVIPLRPGAGVVGLTHVHDWVVVGDEVDDFGRVRELACQGCRAVRFE